jgi:prepilin-type processing-associated H-X9-DG protein
MLLPALSRARAKARQISCLGNAKQVNLGFQMYIQDYNGAYPLDRGGSAGTTLVHAPDMWWNLVYGYVNDDNVLYCPDVSASNYDGADPYTDYCANAEVLDSTDSQMKAPSKTLITCERRRDKNNLTEAWSDYQWRMSHETDTLKRHNNGANFTMVDGHAAWARYTGVGADATSNEDIYFAIK